MAYQKEAYRIMSGGLNLLAPSDKPAPGDSLQLQNWRVDQSGQLRSRRGMDFQSGYLAGDNGHTLFRLSPTTRYLGVDELLYGGNGYNNYQELASGFDGQPLGMAAMQGLTWIMNQAKQLVHDPSVSSGTAAPNLWTPAAPSIAPAAVAVAQDTTQAANFSSGEPWKVTQPDGSTSLTVTTVLTALGTVTIASGSTDVLGIGTNFDATMVGATLQVAGDTATYAVLAVVSTAELTLATGYAADGAAIAGGAGFTISRTANVFNFFTGPTQLEISCTSAGSWVATLASGLPSGDNLGVDGEENDSDTFTISIYATDPTQINQVTLAVDVNNGDFATDYYSVVIPGSALSQSGNSWSQVSILRKFNATGLLNSNPDYLNLSAEIAQTTDATQLDILNQALAQLTASLITNALAFTRTGSTPALDWGTVDALRVTVDVADPVIVALSDWSVSGGSSGTLNGSYQFYVTFDTPDGHESNPSPASVALGLTLQPASITGVQVSIDPQVTMRHIYMQGGSLSTPYRIITVPDNATTGPFEVTVSEQQAQIEDFTIPVSHDPAPACLGLVWHLGKLIAYNSAAYPGRYFWTPTGQPYYFPGSGDTEQGNWQDTGEDTDPILWVTSHNQTLLFYKSRSIARLFGDPETSDPELTSSTVGIVGPRAGAHAGPLDYFVGAEGVYSFNGEQESKISTAIDPIFKNEYTILSGPGNITIPPLAGDYAASCALEHVNGRLYFSYPAQGGGPSPVTLVCDLASGRWYQYFLDPDANGASGFTALYYEGQGRPLLGAVSTASGVGVYELENEQFTDDGNPIPLAWHSRYDDCGLPDVDKVLGELVIVSSTGDANGTSPLTVSLWGNNGDFNQAIGTINSAGRVSQNFPLGTDGAGITLQNFAIRIEDSATTECIIFDAFVYWYVETRWGMAFDTGVIDLGSAAAKQMDGLEFDIEAQGPGTVTWYLRGDLPGGAIAQLETGDFTVTSARTVTRPGVELAEGRRYRLLCVSTVPFKLHGLKARVLEIAEYVNGTKGETWAPRPVAY